MSSTISFSPFQERHLRLFRLWLQQDHIKPFWQESDDDDKLRAKFLNELPDRGIHCFIIEENNSEIGFIQYYEAARVGGGWWSDERPGTFGMDLMIGVADKVGAGLGPKIIGLFIDFIQKSEPAVESIIIDPEPTNKRAIKAFERAGFVKEKEITTPNGAALLMRMNFKI